MTNAEAMKELKILKDEYWDDDGYGHETKQYGDTMLALDMAIKALEQEPCEDEIILTKEEYGQLLSNEFDNGYAKGYREALEQDSVLGKIRAEIMDFEEELFHRPNTDYSDYSAVRHCVEIIDKYREESEDEQ